MSAPHGSPKGRQPTPGVRASGRTTVPPSLVEVAGGRGIPGARDAILARLRAAPAGPAAPLPDLGAWFAADAPANPVALLAHFRANIEAAHAEVHEAGAADWPALLCRLAAQKGVRRLLVERDGPRVDELAAQADAGLQLTRYEQPAEAWLDDLFEGIDAALTPVKSAIADTGSLILWPDARAPRLMSLVPPIHFALLDAADIHANLYAAMRVERWAQGMPTNALVISGPSKTADIQQTLAYGAHGPRELVVIVRHATAGTP